MSQMEIIGIGSAWVNRIATCSERYLSAQGLALGAEYKVGAERYRALCDHRIDKLQYVGGSVANTLVCLSHLGRKVGFVGKASNDGDGLFFLNDLQANGVEMLLAPSDEYHSTSGCFYYRSKAGHMTKVVHLGASITLGFEDMAMQPVMAAKCLLIEADMLDMPKAEQWLVAVLDMAKKSQTKIVLLLSNKHVVSRHRDFLLSLLSCVDIVAGNEVEFEVLSNTQGLDAIMTRCMCPGLIAMMTRGHEGSVVVNDEAKHEIKVYPGAIVDITAAGDYYLAGFLHAYCNHKGLREAGELGSMLAARICQERGTRCFNPSDLAHMATLYAAVDLA